MFLLGRRHVVIIDEILPFYILKLCVSIFHSCKVYIYIRKKIICFKIKLFGYLIIFHKQFYQDLL